MTACHSNTSTRRGDVLFTGRCWWLKERLALGHESFGSTWCCGPHLPSCRQITPMTLSKVVSANKLNCSYCLHRDKLATPLTWITVLCVTCILFPEEAAILFKASHCRSTRGSDRTLVYSWSWANRSNNGALLQRSRTAGCHRWTAACR